MTGEITLRGKVLPIGGLKEKALAARRLGIKTVIIPQGNAREIEELPEVLKRDVRFMPVSNVDEVFAMVLEGNKTDLHTTKSNGTKKTRSTKVVPPINETQRDGVRC